MNEQAASPCPIQRRTSCEKWAWCVSERLLASACILAGIWLLTGSQDARAQTAPPRATPPIGTSNLTFTAQHVPNGFDVRAFVPTGSVSRNCIVSLAESNFAIAGMSPAFCGPRFFEDQYGLLISVFFSTPVPYDFFLTATVYHEGAHGYGPPVLFTD